LPRRVLASTSTTAVVPSNVDRTASAARRPGSPRPSVGGARGDPRKRFHAVELVGALTGLFVHRLELFVRRWSSSFIVSSSGWDVWSSSSRRVDRVTSVKVIVVPGKDRPVRRTAHLDMRRTGAPASISMDRGHLGLFPDGNRRENNHDTI